MGSGEKGRRRYFVMQAVRLLRELGVDVDEARGVQEPRYVLSKVQEVARDDSRPADLRRLLRAEARILAGRNDAAIEELEAILADGAGTMVLGLAWDRLGDLYYVAGRMEDAEKAYSTALRLRPHDESVGRDLERVIWRRGPGKSQASASGSRPEVRSPSAPRPGSGAARKNGARAKAKGVSEVLGLYVSARGAGLLVIQGRRSPGDSGCRVTGSLGTVAQEACDLAWSLWQERAGGIGVRLHFPHAAIPKDGPSLGLGVYVLIGEVLGAFVVPPGLAFTGELDLMGRVLPVGGIEDKVKAAFFSGLRGVVAPASNVEELPEGLLQAIRVRGIENVDGLPPLLDGGRWP